MRPRLVALLLLVSILTLPYAAHAAPPVLHILAAERVDGYLVYAGYISRGYLTIPVVGYLGEKEASFLVGPFGTMSRLRLVNSSTAVAIGSVLARRGMAAAIVFITPSRGSVQGYVVEADSENLYGGDAYVEAGRVVLAATLVRISRGVNTSAVTQESDCVLARLSGGRVEGRVVGSVEYDDFPVLLVRGVDGYLLLGETWSHKASQSAIFVARLDEGLHLRGSYAYDTAAEDTVSDGVVRDGVLYIGGYSSIDGGQALIVVDRGATWKSFTLAFDGGGFVDRVDGDLVSGTGRVGEKLLRYAYTYSLGARSLTLYRAGDVEVTPLTPDASILLLGTSTLVLDSGEGYCAGCNSTPRIEVLDAPEIAGKLLEETPDVRRLEDVLVEKGVVVLHVRPVQLEKAPLGFRRVQAVFERGVYVEEVDWGYRISVFVNANLALLALIVPLIVAALLAWLAARRRGG